MRKESKISIPEKKTAESQLEEHGNPSRRIRVTDSSEHHECEVLPPMPEDESDDLFVPETSSSSSNHAPEGGSSSSSHEISDRTKKRQEREREEEKENYEKQEYEEDSAEGKKEKTHGIASVLSDQTLQVTWLAIKAKANSPRRKAQKH